MITAALVAATAGCESIPSAPDGSQPPPKPPAIGYAKGGIPGPPSDVVIPRRVGPPPHARVRIPDHAGPPAFLSSMVDIGTGLDFSCALRSDGAAFCWGENLVGQLGDGTGVASASAVRVNTDIPFVRLFVGDEIACGLDAAGAASCWGGNTNGQLGAGLAPGVPALAPVPVAAPGRFTEMSLGLRTSCGMALDGLAYCWGGNGAFGVLGVGSAEPTTTVPLPVVNSAAIGLTAVNNGFVTTCGLSAMGSVFCWGLDQGDFGNGAGTVTSSPVPVPAGSGVQLAVLEVGGSHACGLDPQGRAVCWGRRNTAGEQGNGTVIAASTPTSVLGGHVFSSLDTNDTNRSFKNVCGVTPDGQAWCWGANGFGQLGGPSTETCAIGSPGFPPDCSTTPVLVQGDIRFARVTMGGDHTCGLALHGAVYCWGRNHVGQLGNGTLTDRSAPTAVSF